MALVRIEIAESTAEVYSPYGPERLEVIKSIPGRRWDKDGRFWEIPTTRVPSLKAALEAIGDSVVIAGSGERPPPQHDAGAGDAELRRLEAANRVLEREKQHLEQQVVRMRNEAAASDHNWAEQLLGKLSPEQSDKAYKALTKVLHPDAGGDNNLMRDLNVARDSMSARAW